MSSARVIAVEPAFHPSAELLSAHSTGWIPWAADLCVRVHLEGCARCRGEVARLDEGQARLVDALPEAAPTDAALEALIEKLKSTPVEAPSAPLPVGDVTLPKAMAGIAVGRRRWAAPGLWVAHIPEGRRDGWRCYLLRAAAGQRLPMHTHGGAELISVLGGALEDGVRYAAGDFIEKSAGSEHHPAAAETDSACVCLVAAKGTLRWRGVAKILGPALSI